MSLVLQHSPADIVRRLLIAGALGTDPSDNGNWPVSATGEPDLPDRCITVYDTDGMSDGRTMPDGEAVEHYGIQVRVRSDTHTAGWQKAAAIRRWMAETAYANALTIDATNYVVYAITRIGSVLPLGKEAPTSKRSLFTLNATVPLRRL